MEVKRITVLGSGTMGHGITQAASFAGYSVSLYDIDQEMLDRAMSTIEANIEKHFVKKEKITSQFSNLIECPLKEDNLN